jgi:hypothetical protein
MIPDYLHLLAIGASLQRSAVVELDAAAHAHPRANAEYVVIRIHPFRGEGMRLDLFQLTAAKDSILDWILLPSAAVLVVARALGVTRLLSNELHLKF